MPLVPAPVKDNSFTLPSIHHTFSFATNRYSQGFRPAILRPVSNWASSIALRPEPLPSFVNHFRDYIPRSPHIPINYPDHRRGENRDGPRYVGPPPALYPYPVDNPPSPNSSSVSPPEWTAYRYSVYYPSSPDSLSISTPEEGEIFEDKELRDNPWYIKDVSYKPAPRCATPKGKEVETVPFNSILQLELDRMGVTCALVDYIAMILAGTCGTPASKILSWDSYGPASHTTFHLRPEMPLDHGRWGKGHNGKFVAWRTIHQETAIPCYEWFIQHLVQYTRVSAKVVVTAAALIKSVEYKWRYAPYRGFKPAAELPQPYYLFFAGSILAAKMESRDTGHTTRYWDKILGDFIPACDRVNLELHLLQQLEWSVKVSDDALLRELLDFQRARDHGVYVEKLEIWRLNPPTPRLPLTPAHNEILHPDEGNNLERRHFPVSSEDELEWMPQVHSSLVVVLHTPSKIDEEYDGNNRKRKDKDVQPAAARIVRRTVQTASQASASQSHLAPPVRQVSFKARISGSSSHLTQETYDVAEEDGGPRKRRRLDGDSNTSNSSGTYAGNIEVVQPPVSPVTGHSDDGEGVPMLEKTGRRRSRRILSRSK